MERDRVLPAVQERLNRYQGEHQGSKPLFVILPTDEAKRLMEEVKRDRGYDNEMVLTEVNGTKIVSSPALKPGEIVLTNELPESGS